MRVRNRRKEVVRVKRYIDALWCGWSSHQVQIRVPCGHVFSSPCERHLSLLINSLDLLYCGVCLPCVHVVASMAGRGSTESGLGLVIV